MIEATWINKHRNKELTGRYKYIWHKDAFFIQLDKNDSITGRGREFYLYDDTPEWGPWKIKRET